MFSTIKVYLATGIAAVVAIFIAIYNARGSKVEKLEKEAIAKDAKITVAAKVVEKEKEAAKFVADNRVAAAKAEVIDEEITTKYDPNTKFYI